MSERETKPQVVEVKKKGVLLGRFKELFVKIFLPQSESAKQERKYPNACKLIKAELVKIREDFNELSFFEEYSIEISSKEIEKIEYSNFSEVTLKYLEDWENLDFGSNSPNLKPAVLREMLIRDYIFKKEIKKNEYLRSYLKKMNMNMEELIADLQLYVERVVSESHAFRATDHKVLIDHILAEDERWKSQFETKSSGGTLSPKYRSRRENRFFGFPEHTSDEANTTDESSPYHISKRPVYGFFTPDRNGVFNYSGTQPPENLTRQYGKVHCKIRESKYKEASISFGDSLDAKQGVSPLIKPHYLSLNLGWNEAYSIHRRVFDSEQGKDRVLGEINVKNLSGILRSSYTEIQIHNGLRMEDIESLHVSKGNGLSDMNIEELRLAVDKYNSRHPNFPVELILY